MEDFSTILWVVIIVGAMIFNSVSQARKARGKGAQTPPQHGEAWPSIPWNEENDAPEKQQPAHESPVFQPVREPEQPQHTARKVSGQTIITSPASETFTKEERIPEESSFEDVLPESDSSETISWTEFGMTEPEAIREGLRNSSDAKNKQEKKPDSRQKVSEKKRSSNDNTEEQFAELIDEFDLRKAVIYSEILKPKFEEP